MRLEVSRPWWSLNSHFLLSKEPHGEHMKQFPMKTSVHRKPIGQGHLGQALDAVTRVWCASLQSLAGLGFLHAFGPLCPPHSAASSLRNYQVPLSSTSQSCRAVCASDGMLELAVFSSLIAGIFLLGGAIFSH